MIGVVAYYRNFSRRYRAYMAAGNGDADAVPALIEVEAFESVNGDGRDGEH